MLTIPSFNNSFFDLISKKKLHQAHVLKHPNIHYSVLTHQKYRRKLSLNAFYSETFRETLTPKECLDKIFKHVPQLEKYYNLYQLLLFHLQEKNIEQFLGLIQEALPQLNHPFKIVLTTVSAQ